ncbi:carboxypeptidase B-like isoform X1 [Belonocnema kinseyi]|uniref:carboxypeptidase B-like isoform X1 n=1 Tax=Belonocnema kinseyi TaxID=2817044 RepID=UPI00143D6408|nr:carboxypeptidase B-like isoform X1 [Belonocnema kinseyi]
MKSVCSIKIASIGAKVFISIILVSGNPLLETSGLMNQKQNITPDIYNVNISAPQSPDVEGEEYGNFSIDYKAAAERTIMSMNPNNESKNVSNQKSFPRISRKQEFSFMETIETVLATVTNLFNNIISGESKSSRSISNKISYKDFRLLRILPTTNSHVNDLRSMYETEPEDIKFWTFPVKNRSADVLVSPKIITDVITFLEERKIEYTVLISDLQKTMSNENPKMSKEQREDLVSSQGHPMTWKRYHRYGEIMRYLEHLAFRYPTLVELVTIGNSYEGQPLKVVKISSGPTKEGKTKPAIWIDAGMHAREWISIAVATYILSQLVEKNSSYTKLLDNSDWMILPIANPDGYEFSHTTDRLWRKTRSSHSETENEARYTPSGLFHLVSHIARWFFSDCEGVDLNRNFGYHWRDAKVEGTSSDPCHDTYAGPKAFSEPESRAISDYIMTNKKHIRAYFTLHSYSQMWLLPWGYTHAKPSDYLDLMNIAKRGTKALAKIHGTNYKIGPASELLYLTTGASDDWAKGAARIKYSFTLELRDGGRYGFLLPATQIVPTARETWAGIRAIARLVTSKTD